MPLKPPGLLVEPFDRTKFLFASQFRVLNRRLQHLYGLIVDMQRHGKRMAILTAMREGKACRVGEAIGSAVHDLGDHRQGAHGSGANPRHEEQLCEIGRSAIGRRGQIAVQAPHGDIAWTNVVMGWHYEMRQKRLLGDNRRHGRAAARLLRQSLASDAIWPQRLQKIKLATA